jgi:putative copper resistance protein D
MFALNKLLPAGALGFVALAVALVLGGGAPAASTPGLPDAGAVVGWLVPMLSFVLLVIQILFVAISISGALYFQDEKGGLSQGALQVFRMLPALFIAWCAFTIFSIVVKFSYEVGIPLSSALDWNSLRSYLTQTSQGTGIRWQLGIAAAMVVFSLFTRRQRGAFGVLLLSILLFVPPLLNAHAAGAGNHMLAIGTILIHVVSIVLWIAGLLALWLVVRTSTLSLSAIQRFSGLALWSVVGVGISGVLNGWIRVGNLSGLWTGYGALLIAKALLFVVLIRMGYLQRERVVKKWSESPRKMFLRLSLIEFLVMSATVGIAVALAHTPTPLRTGAGVITQAESLTGVPLPAAPTLSRVLFSYQPDALVLAFIVVAVVLYVLGVRTLVKRGDKWPVGRTISFAIAMALLDFATSGGLGLYGRFAFSYHMISHMVLATLVPIGIVLSAPITLALRALRSHPDERGARGIILAILHSRVTSFYAHPVVALILFDGSLFVLYFTRIFGDLMTSHIGHWIMEFHFLAVGTLFFYIVVGVDPAPRKVPHIVRVTLILIAMSLHAFFSVALMSMNSLVDGGYFASLDRPWSVDLLVDQHLGGSVGWAMGEIPIVIALIAAFIQWVKDDSRESKRIDRAADRAEASGSEDEHTRYNAYLAKLAKRDARLKEFE